MMGRRMKRSIWHHVCEVKEILRKARGVVNVYGWKVLKFYVKGWFVLLALLWWFSVSVVGVGMIWGWTTNFVITERSGGRFLLNHNFYFLKPKGERRFLYHVKRLDDMWAARIRISGRLPEDVFDDDEDMEWFFSKYGFRKFRIMNGEEMNVGSDNRELLGEVGADEVRRVYDGEEVKVWYLVRGAVKSSFHYNPRTRMFLLLWVRKYNSWFEVWFG